MIKVLQIPPKKRKPEKLSRLIPFVKEIDFFKNNGLKDAAITETLSLMTYKEKGVDEFVIEYGTYGQEFYVILEGECEVMVPDNNMFEEIK